MAYLSIDPIKIKLKVQIGVLEEYCPDDEIEQLFEDVEKLRDRLKKNRNRIIGKVKDNQDAMKKLGRSKKKNEQWSKYVKNTYAKQLSGIQQRIETKNKEICPNFEEGK